MRPMFKQIRDIPWVSSACIGVLRGLRKIGWMRSARIYSYVPCKGLIAVDAGNGRRFQLYGHGGRAENGLFWDGIDGYEPESMRLWMEDARAAKVVFDVGANAGVFALAAAAAGCPQVHAFEPLRRVHAILARNFAMNKASALHAWPCAVGHEDGRAVLFDPGGPAPTDASLSAAYVEDAHGSSAGDEVDVVAIDSFCRRHRIDRVDLLRIDVEGYEEHVLLGMREIVAASRPVILMPLLPGRETSLQYLCEKLWPKMYSWTTLSDGRGVVLRPIVGGVRGFANAESARERREATPLSAVPASRSAKAA